MDSKKGEVQGQALEREISAGKTLVESKSDNVKQSYKSFKFVSSMKALRPRLCEATNSLISI
jgi:hypothetical protein